MTASPTGPFHAPGEDVAISIVVPTYNSAQGLAALLASLELSELPDFEVIINDDLRTDDGTAQVLERFELAGMRLVHLRENPSRAEGRRRGAAIARGRIILHLDSDMRVTPRLLTECLERANSGFDALVIPERSLGDNFWGRVRAMEKQCYEGVESIEALRCLTAECYQAVGGHNPEMVWSEDKDLDLRVRNSGHRVGRTVSVLLHDEGSPTLGGLVRKKMGYFGTAMVFQEQQPEAFSSQMNPLQRLAILLGGARHGVRQPLTYLGVFVLNAAEFGGILWVRLMGRVSPGRVSRAT